MKYMVEDRLIKFKVFLFNLSNCSLHLIFNSSNFLISLVNCDGLDFIRKREFLDALLDLLKSNFALFLNRRGAYQKIKHFNN